MNDQQLFDLVATHLLAQNEKSSALSEGKAGRMAGTMCMYRGPRGLGCAMFPVLTDDIYEEAMENRGIYDVMRVWPEVAEKLKGVSQGLIGELQAVHDSVKVELWRAELSATALKYKLDTLVLETTTS